VRKHGFSGRIAADKWLFVTSDQKS
jgi:hypothetical protein